MMKSSILDLKSSNLKILLVDDDWIDRKAVIRAFESINFPYSITEAIDGKEAIEILDEANDEDVPYLILLDLNMPRMNGMDFLEKISNNESYKKHLIFVLSTSANSNDIKNSYRYKIAGYFVKDQLERLVEFINIYCA